MQCLGPGDVADFSGFEFDLPDALNINLMPNAFGDLIGNLGTPSIPVDVPIIDIQTPDILGFFESLGGSFDLISAVECIFHFPCRRTFFVEAHRETTGLAVLHHQVDIVYVAVGAFDFEFDSVGLCFF